MSITVPRLSLFPSPQNVIVDYWGQSNGKVNCILSHTTLLLVGAILFMTLPFNKTLNLLESSETPDLPAY